MPEVMAILLLLMIVGALVAVETPNLLFSIISVGSVGFLLSIAFLLMGAPDIAIVQIGVEVVCVVLLIRATIHRDLRAETGHREFFGMMATMAVLLAVAALSIEAFRQFPAFGSAVMNRFADAPANTYLREGLRETGAANIVTAVLLDFRAYDTLGEATILFCSVLGALTVLRRKARKKAEEPDEETEGAA